MRSASVLAEYGRFGTLCGQFRIFPYLCTETRPNGRISTIVQPRTVVKRRGVFPYRLNSSGTAADTSTPRGRPSLVRWTDYERNTNELRTGTTAQEPTAPRPFY